MKQIISFCIIAVMVVASVGCGGKKATTYKTTGRVLLDDKPLVGARVTLHFKPKEGGIVGIPRKPGGTTDDDGKVTITYPGNEGDLDGAPAGDYTVTVTKEKANANVDPSSTDAQAEMKKYMEKMAKSMSKKQGNQMAGKQPKDATKAESLIPDGYASQVQSPLTLTVKEGENTFELKLDSKFKAKKINQ